MANQAPPVHGRRRLAWLLGVILPGADFRVWRSSREGGIRHILGLIIAIGAGLIGLGMGPAEARRVALVIGKADYKVGPLANPVNDAAAVAEAFEKQLKFDKVLLRTNLGAEAFRAALLELSRETSGADLGVVYFAATASRRAARTF